MCSLAPTRPRPNAQLPRPRWCIVHAARADTFREVTELALQEPDFPCVALALVTRMMGEEEAEAFNLVGHVGLAAVRGAQN